MKKLLLLTIIVIFFNNISLAQAQLAPNSPSAIATAYQSNQSAIQANDQLINTITTTDYKLATSAFHVNGKPVPQAIFTQYQSIQTQQAKLLNQQKQLETLSKYTAPALIQSTPADVLTDYQALIKQYQTIALANILTPNASNQEKANIILSNIDKTNQAFGTTAQANPDKTLLSLNQSNVAMSVKVKNASPFQATDSTTILYDFLKILLEHGMRFLKQIIFIDLVNIIQTPFQIAITLWFIFLGYGIIAGGKFDFVELLKKSAMLIIVISLIFTNHGDYYFEWIVNPLIKTFYGLSAWILQESTYGLDQTMLATADTKIFAGTLIVENMWAKSLNIGAYIFNNMSGWGFSTKIFKALAMYIFFVGGFSMLLAKFAQNFSYSLFSLIVYLAMSPVMVCFFPFTSTKPTVILWARGVMNALTLPLVTSLAMGFTLNMLMAEWVDFERIMASGMNGTAEIDFPYHQFIQISGMIWISYLIHVRIDDVVAHLTGGVSPNLTNVVMQLVNTLANTVTAGTNTAMAMKEFGMTNIKDEGFVGKMTDLARKFKK